MKDFPGSPPITSPFSSRQWTVKRLLEWITGDFKNKNITHPRRNAEILLGEVLEMERLQLYLHHDMPLVENQLKQLRDLVIRRRKGEPLQYLLGKAPFRNLVLAVEPGVLIPRPETEVLVDLVLSSMKIIRNQTRITNLNILELGTGSGNISISLAVEDQDCHVWSVDKSRKILEVASKNIKRYGVSKRVRLMLGDWFDPVGKIQEKFHIIVSNPPYIYTEHFDSLPREIKDYEPRSALDGGEKGLKHYPVIFKSGYKYLQKTGAILTECNEYHVDLLVKFLKNTNLFREIEIHKDLAGNNRFVAATT